MANNAPDSPDPLGPGRNATWRSWGALVGVFLISAGYIAYAIAPASVLPLFMDSFAIGKSAASASISAIFLTWTILQIPGGYLLDRHDNRFLVFLGAGLFVLAALLGVTVQSYAVFLGTRLLAGAAAVFIVVGSVNIVGHLFPADREAVGLGIFIASPPFGVAIAQFSGPRIAVLYGWQGAMLAYALLGVVGLAISMRVIRQPIRATGRVSVGEVAGALRHRGVLLVSLASFCTYAVWTFLNTWMPTYGAEVLGIELAAAGAATALVPLAGMLSRPGGGWVSEAIGGRINVVLVFSFLSTVVLLGLLSQAPSPLVFAVLLALAGGAVNLGVGLYLVYVNSLAETATQGTSLSVLLTFSQAGNLIAPIAGGWVISQVSWTAGFGFAAGLAIIGTVVIVAAPQTT